MTVSSEKPIRIVIIESQTLMRAGLRMIVERSPEIKVVGEAGDAQAGLDIVSGQKPDIILFKLDPARSIGLDMISKMGNVSNGSRIILLAYPEETKVAITAIGEGILGIVWWTQTPEVLIKAIQKVHAGEIWIERSLIANLLSGMANNHRLIPQDPHAESIAQLSLRERQVIKEIGQGLKNDQIAKKLCLSATTVRHHLTSIYGKLGVSDRLELLVFAHRNGLD